MKNLVIATVLFCGTLMTSCNPAQPTEELMQNDSVANVIEESTNETEKSQESLTLPNIFTSLIQILKK